MAERQFPLLAPYWPGCPREVPFAFVEPHDAQAKLNHGAELNQLARRGGLLPVELVAVLEDRPWDPGAKEVEAIGRINNLLSAWEGAR